MGCTVHIYTFVDFSRLKAYQQVQRQLAAGFRRPLRTTIRSRNGLSVQVSAAAVSPCLISRGYRCHMLPVEESLAISLCYPSWIFLAADRWQATTDSCHLAARLSVGTNDFSRALATLWKVTQDGDEKRWHIPKIAQLHGQVCKVASGFEIATYCSTDLGIMIRRHECAKRAHAYSWLVLLGIKCAWASLHRQQKLPHLACIRVCLMPQLSFSPNCMHDLNLIQRDMLFLKSLHSWASSAFQTSLTWGWEAGGKGGLGGGHHISVSHAQLEGKRVIAPGLACISSS